MLLENEKQKISVSSSAVDEVSSEESDNSEELESLFDAFVRAQFEQDNEKLKSITLYQAEQLNDDEAVKDSEGVFQVDLQTLTNLGV